MTTNKEKIDRVQAVLDSVLNNKDIHPLDKFDIEKGYREQLRCLAEDSVSKEDKGILSKTNTQA